jgi:tetratricopeptide (TPR) repeat protein
MAPVHSERFRTGRRPEWLIVALILLLTAAVYAQVGGHEFIELDDAAYVTENEQVSSGLSAGGLRWALTAVHGSNWHPLTTLSHMLDSELFGLDPRGPHIFNLLLHLANTLLLYLLLRRSTGRPWPTAFVAALFALHPLHVESVAWISERKDLLSAMFWLLTMILYVRYTRDRRIRWYLLTLLALMLGLLSKPMVVTLPFALLLWDYWPLGRFRDLRMLLVEKLPMFVMAAAAGVVTFLVQRAEGAVSELQRVPTASRLANAIDSYLLYLVDMVWPVGLAVVYPYPTRFDPWAIGAAALLLLVCSIFALAAFRRHPYCFTGWLWYLGTLVPVIGLVHVGSQARADRYTYLPLIGIFILIAWGGAELSGRLRRGRLLLAPLGALVLLSFAALTWVQAGYWKDSPTLFRHSIGVTRNNYQLHAALGTALAKRGESDRAIEQFEIVLRGRPDEVESHYSLGLALIQSGRLREGIGHLEGALQLDPEHAASHDNLGYAYGQLGRLDISLIHYRELVRLQPEDPLAARNLAIALYGVGDREAALRETGRARDLAKRQGREQLTNSLSEQMEHYARSAQSIQAQ